MTESDEVVQTETVVEPELVVDDATALADFNSGFEESTGTPTEAATLTPEAKVESDPTKTDEVIPEVTAELAPELTPATVTQEQLNTLLVKSRSVDELTATLTKFKDDTAGRMGGLERTIKELIASTPTGDPVEVTAADLAEFGKEFPDLAPKLAKDLTAALAKKGITKKTETVAAPPVDVTAMVQSALAIEAVKLEQRMAEEHLVDLYGTEWKTITGHKDSTTPYRLWLNSQPADYREKLLTTNSGVQIAKSIAKFQDYEKAEAAKKVVPKPAPKVASTRPQRLSEAVPPKGGAPASQPVAKTDLDEFHAGFNS